MTLHWTESQRKRLVELDADAATQGRTFVDAGERNRAYQAWEKAQVSAQRERLGALRSGPRQSRLCLLENLLAESLIADGFVRVSTPVLMSSCGGRRNR